MRVTMVKKRLGDGSACRKCVQSEQMLRNRGLWERIDEVVWAIEDDPESPGMRLAARYGIDVAPFFVVEGGGADNGAAVYRSVLKLVRERLDAPPSSPARAPAAEADAIAAAARLEDAAPQEILRWGLERYGADLAIAFSGAEDVALIDMAVELGLPFAVFSIDTGRLHPETHELLDRVRGSYGIEIDVVSPDPAKLEPFVRTKGLFSFYEDGHAECCGVRKVAPLRRALATRRAWATGQRRDQNPDTRAAIAAVEVDAAFTGAGGAELVKLNPLAAWTSEQVWDYIRARGVPFNALHERGYRSIGCAPCTRPVLPGQHERDGRWWWERAEAKECGLHAGNLRRES